MIRARLARALRRLVDLLDPPPEVIDRAVVADGYAQGRADLQLVHTSDPAPPTDWRAVVEHDLQRRAGRLQSNARDAWNDLVLGRKRP